MKKIIKWFAIVFASIIGLLVIAALSLPLLLPLDQIKDYAADRISEAIQREVKIEKVSFNLFSGIKLEKIWIGGQKGFSDKPFITAESLDLHYAFWPIFRRQIIIQEIVLVKPRVIIEGKGPVGAREGPWGQGGQKARGGFSVLINSFQIQDARIDYVDQETKTTSSITKANLTLSGILLSLVKPIDLKFSAIAEYQGKNIPFSLNGKIGVNLPAEKIVVPSLTLEIAGEQASIAASLSHFKTSPLLDLSISSHKLSADLLLSIFTVGTPSKNKAQKGELTAQVNKVMAGLPSKYRLKLKVDLANISLQDFRLDKMAATASLTNKQVLLTINELALYGGKLTGTAKVNLSAPGLSYSVNNLKLKGFNSTPFINTLVESFLTGLPDYKDLVNKVYGTLDLAVDFTGRGVEADDILANAAGKGSFILSGGEIKRLKTLSALGETIKSNTLQSSMKFNAVQSGFALQSRIITAKDFKLEAGDIKVGFNGAIDLAGQNWVAGNRLALKLSPAASQGLPSQLNLFRDDKGWFALDFEMTGPLKNPIPKPILDRPIETAIGKLKIKIDAQKIEIEKKANEAIQQQADEAKRQAEEKAKESLRKFLPQ
ncbi:MAG: AsmA family protein [Candidatus Margulisbacteria bacterium]|nr:AsmA family protein [Candidatus Margulisiibacteriota bacterium]